MRDFLYSMLALAFFLTPSVAKAASPPNIVFILSDDHSVPYLGSYGTPGVDTPNLDRFASQGIRLDRFFTAAPQCVPSRASLMTGRSPVAARITRFSSPLPPDEVVFPEILRKQAGYYTGVCGRSYHLDGSGRKDVVTARLVADHVFRPFTERLDYVNQCGDNQVPERVEEFLDARPAGKPFFLWVNFSDPHHVWNAHDFEPDPSEVQLPEFFPDVPDMRAELARYIGEVNRVDRSFQKVVEVLKERGLYEDSLVIFCGDNGMALPHGKGSLYDPGLNVPFIVRWPGVVQPGATSKNLASGEDLAPTLLEAAGLRPTDRMTGKSFLPLLKGDPTPARAHLFAERGSHGGNSPVRVDISSSSFDLSRCVRTDRYKFIYNCTPWIPYSPVDSAGNLAWRQAKEAAAAGELPAPLISTYFTTPRPVYELYDLDSDPSELSNLSGRSELADAERELREALADKMIRDFDYLPLPAQIASADEPATKKGGTRKAQAKRPAP